MRATFPTFAAAILFGLAAASCGDEDTASLDSDGDGLSDAQELTLGTDPHNADSDADGLDDGAEVNHHQTDPTQADTDGDGIHDGAEVNAHHTDPNAVDSDQDGLSDGAEVNSHNTDPNQSDSDGDGIADGHEVHEGSNPHANDGDHGHADFCQTHTCLCEFHPNDPNCIDTPCHDHDHCG